MADKEKKGKKSRKNRIPSKKWENIKKGSRICPKCGPGVYLATHSGRFSCGKCSYTEFKKE